ncbi:hypothetical protein SAMN05443999_101423 [Roseovarius azorensis]|uniref:Uncharacterized protein n=1 Tax=Roseovarius azorensis TaxID=1287727 RepID=A0A1H7GZL4_9RHOB|nr:hypothetical protein [Roseovarius azorensis]SEK43484.1 hypothetical protein SAMN05443999_101423 [Roseovarius azorensis]
MKAMMTAFVACVLIAAAAPTILETLGYTTEARRTGDAVRLSDTVE